VCGQAWEGKGREGKGKEQKGMKKRDLMMQKKRFCEKETDQGERMRCWDENTTLTPKKTKIRTMT